MSTNPTLLTHVYAHARQRPTHVLLTQPMGGGVVRDYSWSQVIDEARRMASHLKAQGVSAGDRVAILSKNCAEFMIAELAIWMAGGTTVAIFPTETADNVRYVLEHSEPKLLFVGKLDTWAEQAPAVPSGLPCVAFTLAPQSALARYPRWAEIIAQSAPLEGEPERCGEDIAMIMYTSGSTGLPKGVMHNFERITRCTDGMLDYIREAIGPSTPIRVLSYLPLAHVFERAWVECALAFREGAARIFFAESLETFLHDLQRARPTLFISVPRLWLKFQQGVFAKVPEKKLNMLLSIPILSGLIKKKILTGLGLDSVVYAASGSAPIPPALIEWYQRLGLNLIEGYGMTEDFAYSCTSRKDKKAPGYVGVPMPGVELKFAEDGEILIKSPGQFVGYYKQPELTAESFTPDGFFKTGDLGEIRADGLVKITGRKKELFKTAKGKYVAPAPIENKLNACPIVELSLVSGVGREAPYALVQLGEAIRPKLGEAAVRAEVERTLAALLDEVNATLPEYEKLKAIVIARETWTMENGLLTPTMKIKRAKIEASVASEVDRWYASGAKVVWA
ncbi:MAG: AMP-binding protein [Casimicrobiaceae bacterium]|nr:AMP-binding protein [Casimicrobiaceae bacterium]